MGFFIRISHRLYSVYAFEMALDDNIQSTVFKDITYFSFDFYLYDEKSSYFDGVIIWDTDFYKFHDE